MKNYRKNRTRNSYPEILGARPSFESGVLAEPSLAFGGQNKHPCQKTGLGLYGPYSLIGQDSPTLSTITVGIVGPAPMISDAERWLMACSHRLTNDGGDPFLKPHFPGINSEHPFCCELRFGEAWREAIGQREIEDALGPENFYERVKRIVRLYVGAIQVLAERDPRPAVVLCCIPKEIIDFCTVRRTKAGKEMRHFTSSEKRARQDVAAGQGFLFQYMDPTLGIEDQESGHQNLRRGLKAEAMQIGIPTQLVWPRTLRLVDVESPAERMVEDVASRAWNFVTALYHKAGGSPWRLADVENDVCFVGVSFYREVGAMRPSLRTSMAQAFTSSGDGYVLRGSSFDWDESRSGRSPHLDAKGAEILMREVLSIYKRQNRGGLPSRVVVHKSSLYWDEELAGFKEATKLVPRSDFIALGSRRIQFYRPGIYPPIRGTYVKFSEAELLLYTVGYVPFLRTYPGPRVPQPLDIVQHVGDSPWDTVLREILALTKMNWNTAHFACAEPITVAFSRRVGQILAELRPDLLPRPEYRFYM